MNIKIVAPKQESKLKIGLTVSKKENKGLNLEKLAKAVALHETDNCKLGYGAMYNNCFGIKNGNTAPCIEQGKNNMCIYKTPEESYEAFKKIRSKWYQTLPTLALAKKWSGNDRAEEWLMNTLYFYNELDNS